ncbi:MAG: hypothetical protein ACXWNK_09880 [Vulcanimicrobiaceae bacterium]
MKLLRTILTARQGIFRVLPLMRDERVAFNLKAVTIVLALFVISPFNVLGDIPALGLLDDAALLLILSTWFVSQASKQVERRVTATAVDTPGTDLAPRWLDPR